MLCGIIINTHWVTNSTLIVYHKFISMVKDKIVTPRVKHIYIPVRSILEQFFNGIVVPKYEKSSVIPSDMCNKPFLGPIISHGTK